MIVAGPFHSQRRRYANAIPSRWPHSKPSQKSGDEEEHRETLDDLRQVVDEDRLSNRLRFGS